MNWSSVLHFCLIMTVALVVAGLQTTLWFHFFGMLTPPLLWLLVLTYIAIYRQGFPALFQLMALGLMLSAFTAASVKAFYLGILIYFLIVYFVKSRIFWSGAGYFLLICSFGSVVFHAIFMLIGVLIEKASGDLMLLERLTQILLTPVFAFPVYWIMNGIDGLFHRREFKADIGGSSYE